MFLVFCSFDVYCLLAFLLVLSCFSTSLLSCPSTYAENYLHHIQIKMTGSRLPPHTHHSSLCSPSIPNTTTCLWGRHHLIRRRVVLIFSSRPGRQAVKKPRGQFASPHHPSRTPPSPVSYRIVQHCQSVRKYLSDICITKKV
ncbi:hypothetical protein DL98DRAFT_161213 [Cadophora sp. DSE1049]|nr:hypothetical protein DL98DRAFT_161213 [Cadophora sp. DSE1049]